MVVPWYHRRGVECFFFFSSRRRHTRCSRDWSSDVCSSDLSHAIDDLARERLSLQMRTYADVAGRGRGERPFAAVPLADAARYCCGDSEMVLRLRAAFRPELEDHELLALLEQVEVPLIAVLVEMEWRGVLIDLERLGEISRQFAKELAELERAIYGAAGTEFNINSTPQLRHVLFEKHQLPVLKKTKTG